MLAPFTNRWTILALAIGSTIIACFAIGALLHVALGWMGVTLALSYALVFGALISPTDPIAALAILKAAGLPKRLEAIINGESLFNDGVGVVLFTVFLAFAQGSGQEGSPLILFLREVLGGVGLGLAVGFVIHFLMMGLLVVLIREFDYAPLIKIMPVAIVACLIARGLGVYLPILGLTSTRTLDGDRNGLTKLLTWGGLRGGLALALALSLPQVPERSMIAEMTFAVVAFSVLVQGSTIAKLFKPEYLKGLLK
jgi:NhaP-type Na+/H+ or K+/H+ antiporter